MPAGSLIEPHARRECTASGLSLYFSRRHRQLAGHLAGRSVWRLRGQGCAYAAFKNIHFNPACAARWWPTLILPPKSALVQVTRAYAPAISALVRRREQALTYGNCVGPRTRAYCIHPYARTRTHWHSETLTSFSWLSLAHTLSRRYNGSNSLAHATELALHRSRKAPSLLTAKAYRPAGFESDSLAQSNAALQAASRASSSSPYAARCLLCSSA
jgi:hypothetical protein